MSLFITPNWPVPSCVKAYSTCRELKMNDNPDSWDFLQKTLELPTKPILIQQKHTNIAIPATEENRNQIADASFTDQLNHICVVTTADCVPLLLCHHQGTEVAAIHAGWRGLASGIIAKTIEMMQSSPHELLVWLGPAISQSCYEVGDEVRDAFLQQNPQSIDYFIPSPNQRWMVDLYGIARLQLTQLKVNKIYGGEYCTYSDPDRFYSFRREKNHNGRMAHLIWMSG